MKIKLESTKCVREIQESLRERINIKDVRLQKIY